jgi:hypothetical protein
MGIIWKIDRNSGARARLVANGQGKQVWRPQSMSRDDFFRLLPEGSTIDDAALELMFLLWK